MENEEMKKCPYCAELIKAEAIKCRYCGSNLSKKGINLDFLTTPGYWHRVSEGKKIAGVCTGLAHQFDAPIIIMPLRLFFILTTIFYGFGIILYILLWLLMSSPVDTENTSGVADSTVSSTKGSIKKEKPKTAKPSEKNSSRVDENNVSESVENTNDNNQGNDTQAKPKAVARKKR